MKNEDENELGMYINDVSSDILSKKSKNISNKTKLILGITASIIIIIAIIIIIIILSNKKNNNEDDKINPEKVTGEILCKYYIEAISNEINLLGNEFLLDPKMDIYINDKKIKISKSFKFLSLGEYKIQFIFYNNKITTFLFLRDIVIILKFFLHFS